MNPETQTFNFNDATLRTLTDTAGDLWFVLKDCMNILGLGNPTETAKMFDDDEFSTTEVIDSIGRRQQTYIISEAGLYRLVLKSRKPEAKEFKRWMTHEVLPTIHKHGTAMTQQTSGNAPTRLTAPMESFNFENNPVRTTQDKHGNPLFCAKDIATILGYANPAKAVTDHCKGFPIWKPLESAGGIQQARFITEGDMYRLIASSKLPTAERFESWIYDEVLPSIRKTGGYIPATEADSDEDIMAKALLIAQKTIERKNQQLLAKDRRIMELEPKAKALDDFTNVPDAILVRDAAKLLSNAGTPIGEKELREWLSSHNWIYRHAGTWSAASERVKAGHLAMVESRSHGRNKDGSIFAFAPTVKITRKGLTLLHTRLGETRLNETFETTIH